MPSSIKNPRLKGLPGDLIRTLVETRHAHGWSQRTLAGKVGLPQVHISGIETGKVAPRYNTLLDLVRVLDYDLMLVPRSLVPAVHALIRDSLEAGSSDAEVDERPLYGDAATGARDEP